MQGIFSFSQSGEVLTVRAPRNGEDWMKLNPREDDQRWGAINAAMAVLASSKTTPDRMMLEQYEALVQPTQFIKLLRKTMPMTEAQLDMFTTMHDSMLWCLNALEMLHKGGQRAVDEFTASGLHGLEKRKANALQKAKRANPNDGGGGGGGGGGGNGNQARRRARRAGGGYEGFSGNPAPSSTQTLARFLATPAATPAAAAAPGAQLWEMPQNGPQDGRLPFRLVTAVARLYLKDIIGRVLLEYTFLYIDVKKCFAFLRFLENFFNNATQRRISRLTIERIRETFSVSRFLVNRKKALISFRNNLESSSTRFWEFKFRYFWTIFNLKINFF
jgi:hypothetical protein